MKTTMDLPDELLREVKLRAVTQGRTVRELVATLLRQGLGLASGAAQETPHASAMVEMGKGGLPVIRCATSAPATRMGVEELLKLERQSLEREDLQRAGLPH